MKRILLIEDNPSQRELYESELFDEGYDVTTAKSGTEGLQCFLRVAPDLVIVDMLLPDMSGIDVMEKILSQNPVN